MEGIGGAIGGETGERVDRPTHAAPLQLVVEDPERGIPPRRQFEHRPTMVARGTPHGRLVGGHACRDEQDPVEGGLLPAALGDDEVPDVDGIETAAEDADPHARVLSGPPLRRPAGPARGRRRRVGV